MVCLTWLIAATWATAQQVPTAASASATQVTTSSGRPSSIGIKQNILKQKQAALARELTEVARCIRTSGQSQVLRDPEGNVNIVPDIDVTNCARRLAQLLRQQSSLGRAANQLAQDAQAQANSAQRALEQARTKARLQAISGSSSGAMSVRRGK
jgi:hypothetical protein